MGDIAVNAKELAIAFGVKFESDGFPPKADEDIGSEKYFYVFKLAPTIEFREFDEFDMKPMFGEATAKVLVRPNVLHQLFASK